MEENGMEWNKCLLGRSRVRGAGGGIKRNPAGKNLRSFLAVMSFVWVFVNGFYLFR